MDIAMYFCGFLVICFGTALGISSLKGHYYIGLWSGVATFIAATIGAGLWVHDFWQKQDTAQQSAQSVAPAEFLMGPMLPALRVKLARGAGPDIFWRIKNYGPVALQMKGTAGSVEVRPAGDDSFAEEINRLTKLTLIEGPEALMPPNAESGHSILDSQTILSDEIYDDIIAGKKFLYTCLVVAYLDSQGGLRVSTACCVYNTRIEAFMTHKREYNQIGLRKTGEEIRLPARAVLKYTSAAVDRFQADKPSDFCITFDNAGGTSARNIRSSGINSDFVPVVTSVDQKLNDKFGSSEWEMKPDPVPDILPLNFLKLIRTDKIIPTAEQAEGVSKGSMRLFLWGRITYTGPDDAPHWTNYCIAFDGTTFTPYKNFTGPDPDTK